MFSVCLFTGGARVPPPDWGGCPRGYPPITGGAPPGVPPPQQKMDKKNGQSFGQKMDKILDKNWTNILETFGGGGGAGGTPLVVTQEDCLVRK